MIGKTLYATDGETLQVVQQWAAECEKRGTDIRTSTWAFTGSGSLTDEALTGTKATALLAPTSCGTLTNTVELESNETLIASRAVVVDGVPPMDYRG